MRVSPHFGFSKEQRLHRKVQIAAVLARGRSSSSGGVRLHSTPSEAGPRLGVIAGRHAWPKAVDRNRFRRLAREAFRLLQHELQRRDYIIRALKAQRDEPDDAQIRRLLAAWRKTGVE